MPMMPPCGGKYERGSWAFGTQVHTGAKEVREKHASTYLNCHILEAVPRIRHDFAKAEYGAEGIRVSIVNA